jgi:DNA-binding MarR family transcriptional regulator
MSCNASRAAPLRFGLHSNSMKSHRSRRATAGRAFVRDYLPYLLGQANHAVHQGFAARLRAAGLASTEWRVLATLSDGDGLTIGELAAEVLAQQPTLTKLVDRMERAGLVERRGDAADGRRTLVFETARGQAVAVPLLAQAKAHERAALDAFSPQEGEALKRALRTLSAPQPVVPLSETGRRPSVSRSGHRKRRRAR